MSRAAEDWRTLLQRRAEELVEGAQAVLVVPAVDDDGTINALATRELLNDVLQDFASTKYLLSQQECIL